MVYPYGQGGEGELSLCGHFSDKGEGQFLRFYADVLYGRPLKPKHASVYEVYILQR